MRKKDSKLFSKIVMILFLVMIVLGFTVPGFLQSPLQDGTAQNTQAEPRLCQTDAGCTLRCDGSDIPVLCTQNLCMQNSCEEGSYFLYREEPITFHLMVSLEKGKPMTDVSLYANTQNQFVQAEELSLIDSVGGNKILLYTRGLYLQQILEKFQMGFTEQCFVTPQKRYCGEQGETLIFKVNGEESTEFANYVPQQNDVVEIIIESN